MPPRRTPVHRLFHILPDVAELAPLREAILGASAPDPAKEWARSAAYATYDKRVVAETDLEAATRKAAAEVHRRITRLYEAMTDVLRAASAGAPGAAATRLVQLGEAAEAEESWQDAVAHYTAASRLADESDDRSVRSLALRRLARARWHQGAVKEAYRLYRRSRDEAQAAGDREGGIVAATGLGNMRSFQGRWADARTHYEDALAWCGDEFPRLRGQLYANLSLVAREQHRLEEAGEWLERALPLWEELDARSAWWNNRGLLFMARGELDRAEAAFHDALEHALSHFERAMVLDNLAELAMRRQRLWEAEAAARRAEEHALAAGSPRALAEVYTRLGKVFRLRADPNSVTFFEKALELCRGRSYHVTQGHAHLEYGIFRRALGDGEEARAHMERAQRLFARVGAVADHERAARELAHTTDRLAAET